MDSGEGGIDIDEGPLEIADGDASERCRQGCIPHVQLRPLSIELLLFWLALREMRMPLGLELGDASSEGLALCHELLSFGDASCGCHPFPHVPAGSIAPGLPGSRVCGRMSDYRKIR